MAMQQIDPGVYDDLIGWGNQSANLDPQIAQQQAMAQRLRAAGTIPANARMSGRIASAPSKWEVLGALANQGVAGARDQQALGLQQQQAALRTMQTNRVLEALKAMRMQQQPANTNSGDGFYTNPQAGY